MDSIEEQIQRIAKEMKELGLLRITYDWSCKTPDIEVWKKIDAPPGRAMRIFEPED